MNEDQSLKLFLVLSRASRAVMDHAVRDIRRYELNTTEFAVLELLYHKGAHPLQQIGKKILLTSGSITYVIDNLEKKGYLSRKASPNDRRITYADITAQGKELLEDIFPHHAKAISQAVAGLDPNEQKIAIDLLKKLGKAAASEIEE